MESIEIIIEVAVAIVVVALQFSFFNGTAQKIKDLSNLFPSINLDETYLQSSDTLNGELLLIRIDSNLYSIEFTTVIDSINKYLKKNQGATDFSIIKSIVERSIETKENTVSNNITLPLYIGLMGTFTGIIMGLVKIGFFGGVTEENINSFIGGVVIAMVASFCGLLLTVWNTSKNFKDAKAICDERKNNFYNFLQVELLPHLSNSLYDALDKLKININDFNKKFESNIQLFDRKFSDNISSLGNSVESLSENIDAVVVNTQTQKEFLVELKNIGYNKMAEANVKVFQLFKENAPTFIKFVEKQKELTDSMEQAVGLVQTIESILNRIKTFEDSINNLGDNLNHSDFIGNELLRRVDANLKYLNDKFELLKRFEDASLAETEIYFRNKYEDIQKLTDGIKREVESALDLNINDNPLHKLNLLEGIDNNMSEIKSKINLNEELKKISDDLGTTKSELSEIKTRLIEEIEKSKNKSFKKNNKPENTNDKDKNKEADASTFKPTLINRFISFIKSKGGRKE
jgi:hypothetical protein